MTKWIMLSAAILAEVAGTLALRAAVDEPLWTIGVVIAYLTAFTLLGLTLRTGMPIGVAYGIWGAAGVALVALLATGIFGEQLSPLSMAGIAVIILGVVLVESGAHPERSADQAEARA